jgi:D-alanyl-D-alanine carboxypeptidase (penicillin-binding protein 5/6)
LFVIVALAIALGVVYVFVTPLGLPYDEPSHWSTVQYYANHGRLPVLGHPGVTYEAYMGPVAYSVDAVALRAAQVAGASVADSLRLVRLLGVLEFALTVLLVALLTRRIVLPLWAGLAAVCVLALNPMLLTMSACVQNDSLALLLSVLAVFLTVAWLDERPSIGASVLVGLVSGVALLTKLNAWVVVVAVPAWLAWVHGRHAVYVTLAFLASVAAVSGWWFVRNVALYGDLTAASAVDRTGVSFSGAEFTGVSSAVHIVRSVVTYLWLPTEYVRNLISAPASLKGLLLVVTLAAGVLATRQRRNLNDETRAFFLVAGCTALSLAWWLGTYLLFQAFSPRVAYVALPMWVVVVALALSGFRRRTGLLLVVGLIVLLNVWTIAQLRRVEAPSLLPLMSMGRQGGPPDPDRRGDNAGMRATPWVVTPRNQQPERSARVVGCHASARCLPATQYAGDP